MNFVYVKQVREQGPLKVWISANGWYFRERPLMKEHSYELEDKDVNRIVAIAGEICSVVLPAAGSVPPLSGCEIRNLSDHAISIEQAEYPFVLKAGRSERVLYLDNEWRLLEGHRMRRFVFWLWLKRLIARLKAEREKTAP